MTVDSLLTAGTKFSHRFHKLPVKAGDVVVIPPNIPYEFIALENTIDIDVFSPVRQDWIDNTAGYLSNVQ